MCSPHCIATVKTRIAGEGAAGVSRRHFLGAAAAVGAAALPGCALSAARARGGARVVDLSHVLSPTFPTLFGAAGISVEQLYNFAEHKVNGGVWHVNEHCGTHLDAPIHFSAAGATNEAIPMGDLVAPLAVVDISARAEGDADALLVPEDLRDFESAHGPIPAGACVAMYSGWESHVNGAKFRNADGDGVMHFPGFHPDATQWLLEEREVRGIAVDTLSIDRGMDGAFPVHYQWLGAGRWGMECAANLAGLPAVGATLIVGALPIQGATGGPARLMALV